MSVEKKNSLHAFVICSHFPIVSLVGWWKPNLPLPHWQNVLRAVTNKLVPHPKEIGTNLIRLKPFQETQSLEVTFYFVNRLPGSLLRKIKHFHRRNVFVELVFEPVPGLFMINVRDELFVT